MQRVRGVLVVGALAVAVSAVAAGPAVAAKGGNNDTAKACQHGGWQRSPGRAGRSPTKATASTTEPRATPRCRREGRVRRIGGSFSLNPNSWLCAWNLGAGSGASLKEACDTDSGEFEEEEPSGDDIMATCFAETQPAT